MSKIINLKQFINRVTDIINKVNMCLGQYKKSNRIINAGTEYDIKELLNI